MPVIMDRLAKLNPGPVQDTLPILIGGGGEKVTLRIVAQYATIWNGQGEPAVLARKNRILDEWCARVGRDPGEIFGAQLVPSALVEGLASVRVQGQELALVLFLGVLGEALMWWLFAYALGVGADPGSRLHQP